MIFVKKKKSQSLDEWIQTHLAYIYFTERGRKRRGARDIYETLRGYLKAHGIDNYKIIYHESYCDILIDDVTDLLEEYPECNVGDLDDNLACLEEKTGKKYVLAVFDLGVNAVAEVL
jgi:hypothetical protein